MKPNQYAIYQLKFCPENRKLRFRSWADVQKQGLSVRIENYEEVYLANTLPQDTPESIWKRFREKPPKKFKGHSISVSDVIVLNKDGVVSAYYVDKAELFTIAGFIRLNSSGTLVTIDTRDFLAEGYDGSWVATDEVIVDGRQFFLLENQTLKRESPFLVVDAQGKVVADDVYRGFDDGTLQKIQAYLHPPEEVLAKTAPIQTKVPMENWQKAHENGEYLRSAEMSEESNYNMIDGLLNNKNQKQHPSDPKHRPSVLAKLRQKQKEIAARSGKAPEQENTMERNRK